MYGRLSKFFIHQTNVWKSSYVHKNLVENLNESNMLNTLEICFE